VLITS